MAKTIFKEMGGTYSQVGDYILPNLGFPPKENSIRQAAAQTLFKVKS